MTTRNPRVREGSLVGLAVKAYIMSETVYNKNLAIANRSRVRCAHNTLRAYIGLNNFTPRDLEI